MNNFIKYIKEEDDILYGYHFPPEFYGISFGVDKYVLITKWAYKIPKEFESYYYICIPIQLFLDWVTKQKLFAWELSCCDRKYIIKEHVKIIMQFNPIKLRDNLDEENNWLASQSCNDLINQRVLYSKMYKNIIYTNQILDNHKIINFKAVGFGLEKINSAENSTAFKALVIDEYFKLCQKTDNLKRNRILEKFKKKMEEKKSAKCAKIIEIGATWCPGCKALKENLKEYDNRIPLEYIDCDTDDDVSSKYGVRNIPVLLFLDDKDEVIKKNVGVTTLNNVYCMISDINNNEQ